MNSNTVLCFHSADKVDRCCVSQDSTGGFLLKEYWFLFDLEWIVDLLNMKIK